MSTWHPTGPADDVTLFTAVDRTKDPGFFARFLDEGNALKSIQASKPLILDGLRLRPGQVALDVGCGAGADVIEMARLVGSGGRVVDVDVSEALISEAQRRWGETGLPVEFRIGDAQELDFDSGSFDACRTERMLMHISDENRASPPLAGSPDADALRRFTFVRHGRAPTTSTRHALAGEGPCGATCPCLIGLGFPSSGPRVWERLHCRAAEELK